MTSRVPCRFFLAGNCRNGAQCWYSHDSSADADTAPASAPVCKYFLAGNCSFGARCRYSHVRHLAHEQCASGDTANQRGESSRSEAESAEERWAGGGAEAEASRARQRLAQLPSDEDLSQAMSGPQRADAASGGSDDAEAFALAEEAAWLSLGLAESGQREAGQQELEEPGVGASAVTGVVREGSLAMYDAAEGLEEWAVGAAASAASSRGPKDPADLPLCSSYVAGGWCARGEDCLYIHGELCELCERFALHPYNAEQVETHIKSCTALQQRLEARALSAAKECSICLERVLAKPEVKQRRFGLLTSCSHSFCLGCIRGWRSATDSDADVDTALRTCPICRMQSWYVVPSPVWPSSEEEKKEIIEGYRRKLSLIDCKHWNRGRSTCPFGTSCFYRHAYEDGSLQDRTLVRRATDQHGDLHILGSVRLSQFFDDPEVQQMLRRRRGFRGSVRR